MLTDPTLPWIRRLPLGPGGVFETPTDVHINETTAELLFKGQMKLENLI